MERSVKEVKLFCDGGCRGNPGPGAIGLLILDGKNQELHRGAECIGHTTNNRAEYRSLIRGLDLCAKHTRDHVTCFMDSQLVVNQMNGVWRLKNDELRSLFHEVKKCEQLFREVVYQQVGRTNPFMKKVDRLLNEAFEGR
jgi:ribonuclease HI